MLGVELVTECLWRLKGALGSASTPKKVRDWERKKGKKGKKERQAGR